MQLDTRTRGDCFFCWAWNLESVLDTLIDYGCDITSVTPVTYIWLPFFTFGLRYAITYVQPLYDDNYNEDDSNNDNESKSNNNEPTKPSYKKRNKKSAKFSMPKSDDTSKKSDKPEKSNSDNKKNKKPNKNNKPDKPASEN